MKAIVINAYGAADVLQLMDIDQPTPKPNQIKVKIQAAGVNPVDWKIRKGMLKLVTGSRFPRVLGSDLAGEVVECGDQATRFKVGDAIYAFTNPTVGGAYAEFAVIPEQIACLKPQNLTFAQAAAAPLAATTALQALRDQGKLQSGQTVLVNGAAGGVGLFAIQIAKAMGATVTGVCSGPKIELVEGLGCDRVIDYTQQDFTQAPDRYNLIFDAVSKQSFRSCKRILEPNGVYVNTLPSPSGLLQTLLTGLTPGKKSKFILVQPNGRDLDYLRSLFESQKLRPIIDRTYPLAETAAAHTYSETERATGKLVIVFDGEKSSTSALN
ncbi:MAG: NAD(P)-dependent alcohol dehydrogenase [Leptolyngbyaceae cyanobacterium MO_188.B28]|nr:NAD(P)-dependent alcohol dehydrogenase [Leptolyngbyaceae cyanobacterium MO_188.B28]